MFKQNHHQLAEHLPLQPKGVCLREAQGVVREVRVSHHLTIDQPKFMPLPDRMLRPPMQM